MPPLPKPPLPTPPFPTLPLPTPDDVAGAARRLHGQVVRTPTIRNSLLDQLTGGTVLLKAECLQRTGSFKLRGATNAALQLGEAERRAGVLTYSSGNHGQALACAAASLGMAATVFMPDDAPEVKVASTRRWGAEIVRFNRRTDDREAVARAHAARTGATIIPPFEHPHVIAGQGTLALELLEDAGATMDALLVCTGGGGMVAGCALAMEGASPGTRVWAVEPEGSDDTLRSLRSGTRQGNPPGGSALCDALLSPMPGEMTFALNRPRLAGGLVVSDAEVLAAIAFAFTHLKLVLEPGGAVALAALLSGRFEARGRVVGAVLSGGNVDAAVFARALAA
jgi:threonine dehydratase